MRFLLLLCIMFTLGLVRLAMGMKWYLVLILIFLIFSEVEHFSYDCWPFGFPLLAIVVLCSVLIFLLEIYLFKNLYCRIHCRY